ncbi:MAG: winged helix-turn-helix transcriptional regulator [Coprococcus sp.]|nr:winged helix-turn-helix transcriptional regulator [Coprococcus sp.]
MTSDFYEEEGMKIFPSDSPGWELFFSMHVLSDPGHHICRRKWCLEKDNQIPVNIRQIKKLKELTNSWLFLIDSPFWHEFRSLEILELLEVLRKKNIYQWNTMIHYTGKQMCIEERDVIINTIETYYYQSYRGEERLLNFYLKKMIDNELKAIQTNGIWRWCKKVHPRLIVEKEELIYRKNHEYRISKKEIQKIFLSVSTFLDPHLWFYRYGNELEIVMGISVERREEIISEDTVAIFKALGDSTRLKIIRLLISGIDTTKDISSQLGVSEACVSKHLNLLYSVGFVDKTRNGLYIRYHFKLEKVDFIPYILCETLLR